MSRPQASDGLRDSWKASETQRNSPELKRRWFGRALFTTALAGGAIYFLLLLFPPLLHPNIHFMFFTGADYGATGVAPIPFFQEDAIRYLSIAGEIKETEFQDRFVLASTSEDLTNLVNRAQKNIKSSSDVLMIYSSFHAGLRDGKPVLYCREYDPSKPNANYIDFAELLGRLNLLPVQRIVIMLETQHANSEFRYRGDSDVLVEAFNNTINRLTPSRVMVILSHSPGQSSFASWRWQGTAFAKSVSAGLMGAADSNNDHLIRLQEFYDYLTKTTNAIVQRESDGIASQSPLLLGDRPGLLKQFGSELVASVPSARWGMVESPVLETQEEPEDSPLPATVTAAAEPDNSYWSQAKGWMNQVRARKAYNVQERFEDRVDETVGILPSSLAARIRSQIIPEDDPNAPKPTAEVGSEESTATESNSNAEANSKEGPPSLNRLNGRDANLLACLQLIWEFCAYLETANGADLRASDLSPVAWQALIAHIHSLETAVRANAYTDPKQLKLDLFSTLIGLNQMINTGTPTVGERVIAVSGQRPKLATPSVPMLSIGMAEQFAKLANAVSDERWSAQVKLFDEAIQSSDPAPFLKWIEQAPEDIVGRYREFQVAMMLSGLADRSWSVCRQLLVFVRKWERQSFEPFSTNHAVSAGMDSAQRHWTEAFRCALDQIGDDWAGRCERLLRLAAQDLEQASLLQRAIVLAIQTRNDSLVQLPAVLQWNEIMQQRFGIPVNTELLGQFAQVLNELTELLVNLEEASVEAIDQKRQVLAAASEQIRLSWARYSNLLVTGEIADPAREAWVYDALLATSLDRSADRGRVLKIDPQVFSRSADNRALPLRPLSDPSGSRALAKLAQQLEILQKSSQPASSAAAIQPEKENLDPWVNQLQRELQRLRREEIAIRLQGYRGDGAAAQRTLETLLKSQLALCVERYRRQCVRAIDDALADERTMLESSRIRIDLFSQTYFQKPASNDRGPTPVEIRSTADLHLETAVEATGEFFFRNRGENLDQAWLLLDYDPTLIEVQLEPNVPGVLRLDAKQRLTPLLEQIDERIAILTASTRPDEINPELIAARKDRDKVIEALQYPARPISSVSIPSFSLSSGQEQQVRYRIRRLRSGPPQTKLSCKLVSAKSYLRADANVYLPASDTVSLVVDSRTGNWTQSIDGIRLNLNPNRSTEVRLGVINQGNKVRAVDVEIYSCKVSPDTTLPAGWIDSNLSSELVTQIGALVPIAQINDLRVDSDRRPVWFVPQAAAAGSGAAAEGQTGNAADSGSAEGQKKGQVISDCLIGHIIDRETKQSIWQRIDLRVRHPRSYIQAVVGYDAISELIEVQLAITDPIAAPANGISVVGRIAEELPRGTEMQMTGSLLPTAPLNLYCRVPATAPRNLTLELDIDGFPRAFVISVPCWKTSRDIPIAPDHHRLRFAKPGGEVVLGPAHPATELELKVDALPGAFDSKRDHLEIGWDLDQDRVFDRDNPLRLQTDRLANYEVERLPTGNFLFRTTATDIRLALPFPTVTNRRIGLLSKIYALGETVWSEPIEVIVDEEPPIITGIQLYPGPRVAAGSVLKAQIGAEDGKLSGVEKVLLAVDIRGVDRWELVENSVDCQRHPDASWIGVVPTSSVSPGKASVIVIAEDRAGNRSKISRVPVEFVDPEAAELETKSQTREMIGTVNYSGDIVAGAKVSLLSEKGSVLMETRSDSKGLFRWSAVPLGNHKLVVTSVIKNKPRRSETPVVVDATSRQSIRLSVQLK